MSSARIGSGGGTSFTGGSSIACVPRNTRRATSRRSAAARNPKSGEITSESIVSATLPRLIPWPNTCPARMELARPTPRMEPMRVCELDAGMPRYQVPRFQMIAESSKERMVAMPMPEPPATTRSSGRSLMMPIATEMPPMSTPLKLKNAETSTAVVGLSAWV
jgi:hypothetical protein